MRANRKMLNRSMSSRLVLFLSDAWSDAFPDVSMKNGPSSPRCVLLVDGLVKFSHFSYSHGREISVLRYHDVQRDR